jgi:DNA-binding MarR family transcriptional regulator
LIVSISNFGPRASGGVHLLQAAACVALREIEGAPRLTTELAKVFLSVALRPNLTMAELASALYLEQSVCSRRVGALASYRGEGHGLLTAIEDPRDRRRKIIELTAKGQRIADEVLTRVQAAQQVSAEMPQAATASPAQ